MHAQRDGQLENIMPLAAHRMDSKGMTKTTINK